MRIISFVLICLMLSGCGVTRLLDAPKVRIAQSQLECIDAPTIPPVDANDNQIAVFMLEQRFVIKDCKRTLVLLGEALEAQNVTILVPDEAQSVRNGTGPLD